MKTIAISEINLSFLKRLKREKRKSSLDDVISLLIETYQKFESQDKPKESQSLPDVQNIPQAFNPFEFAQNNPCPYRTIIKCKSGFMVLCAETKKIPLEACITRQKRYLQFNKKCIPIGREKPKKPHANKPMRTRIYRDEFESAYYPNYVDSDDYFHDDWGNTF